MQGRRYGHRAKWSGLVAEAETKVGRTTKDDNLKFCDNYTINRPYWIIRQES
jgi:hypothetical protein